MFHFAKGQGRTLALKKRYGYPIAARYIAPSDPLPETADILYPNALTLVDGLVENPWATLRESFSKT
jgi:hypothetical protein